MPEQQKDYSGFDRMSTEMLEEILRGDFELSGDEQSDMDAVLYIMEVIAKRKKQEESREYPDAEQAWNSFNENYRSNLEASWFKDDNDSVMKSEVVAHPQTTLRQSERLLRRIIGIAAAVFVIVGCTSLTANALGYNIWQIIAQWTSQTFGFASEPSEMRTGWEDGTIGQYNSLQEALDAYGITENLVPTWIPPGYELEIVEVIDSSSSSHFTALYQSGDDYILVKINNIDDESYRSFEKDDSVIDVVEVDGIQHYIMSNLESNTAAWINGRNECSISTSISRNELKKMVQSIYER